ncbi:YqaA family protein [Bowmanella dokdonensis]|uniref:DedA family protein n=1 Tax=Bowmanella dokdonensis TaxID=751969 RepID=A0A939DPY9_9ALTE|nr:VTT domain-containing protein [Bowmanella dokdonensis]MBN7826819.1 DedA family protein [Bowmanella dokdonensis]
MRGKTQKWLDRLRQSDHALVLLFVFSALEATIVPIPLELVLIPYMLLERQRIWLLATIALAGCLTGALAGYWIGLGLFDSAGQWLIEATGATEQFEQFRQTLQEEGFFALFMVGVTPVPFQVAMLAAGATDYPLGWFMLAAGLSRGIRYYGLALLVLMFGEQATEIWRRHSTTVGVSLLAIFVLTLILNFL